MLFLKLRVMLRKFANRLLYKNLCLLEADGAQWAVNPHDRRFNYYFKYCAGWPHQEHSQLKFLLSCCDKIQPSTFVDVGGNFGYYPVMLLKHVPSIKSALVFEPDRDALRYIQINALINKLHDRVQAHGMAISNQKGEMEICIDSSDAGCNTLSTTDRSKDKRFATARRELVKTDTLDNIIKSSNQTIVVKIDVEGNEMAALEGAKQLLESNACLVQIEIFADNSEAIKKFFAGLNYNLIHEVTYPDRSDSWWVSPSLAGLLDGRVDYVANAASIYKQPKSC